VQLLVPVTSFDDKDRMFLGSVRLSKALCNESENLASVNVADDFGYFMEFAVPSQDFLAYRYLLYLLH
jgi:hypothetical protein